MYHPRPFCPSRLFPSSKQQSSRFRETTVFSIRSWARTCARNWPFTSTTTPARELFFKQIRTSPSPSVRRIATSAEESHPLNSVAPLATILNDVFTFSVGGAFLKLHCLFTYNAIQETYQRAFIVVQ